MEVVSLLEKARAAGLSVDAEGEELVVSGPPGAEPIALQVLEHKASVMAHLGREDGVDAERGLEGLEWVFEVVPGQLPSPPFRLNSGMTVTDNERFLRSLRSAIAEGAQGPRARTGALQKQCQELREIMNNTTSEEDWKHE